MENESVSLYGFAAALAKECGSLYRDIRPCKDNLLGFMDANGWFGQKAIGSGDNIRIERPEDIKERLLIWLRAYRRSAKEKTDILFEVGGYQAVFGENLGFAVLVYALDGSFHVVV